MMKGTIEHKWRSRGDDLPSAQMSTVPPAGGLPPGVSDFGETLRVLNAAAHGVDVSPDAAAAALDAGTQLLDALRRRWEEP
jgi:hypothetical protein